MPNLLLRWIIFVFAILLVAGILPGVRVDGVPAAIAGAAVLGALNLLVKPLLVFLTLPLTFFSLGFFLLILNGLIFQFAGYLVPGLHIDSFGSAFFGALIVSFVSWLLTPRSSHPQNKFFFFRSDSRPFGSRRPPTENTTFRSHPNSLEDNSFRSTSHQHKKEKEIVDLAPGKNGEWQ